MPCANCRKDLLKVGHEDSGEDEFILLGQPPGPSEAEDHSNENRKISIAASVGIIFEASLRLHKVTKTNQCSILEPSSVVMQMTYTCRRDTARGLNWFSFSCFYYRSRSRPHADLKCAQTACQVCLNYMGPIYDSWD